MTEAMRPNHPTSQEQPPQQPNWKLILLGAVVFLLIYGSITYLPRDRQLESIKPDGEAGLVDPGFSTPRAIPPNTTEGPGYTPPLTPEQTTLLLDFRPWIMPETIDPNNRYNLPEKPDTLNDTIEGSSIRNPLDPTWDQLESVYMKPFSVDTIFGQQYTVEFLDLLDQMQEALEQQSLDDTSEELEELNVAQDNLTSEVYITIFETFLEDQAAARALYDEFNSQIAQKMFAIKVASLLNWLNDTNSTIPFSDNQEYLNDLQYLTGQIQTNPDDFPGAWQDFLAKWHANSDPTIAPSP